MLPQTLEGRPIEEIVQTREFNDFLMSLTSDYSNIRHSNYDATVKHSKEMAVHAWGEKPTDILDKARPREDDAIRKYRLDSWEPITLSKFEKAISILQKIFNPNLFAISFPPQPGGVKLGENETLEKYMRENYPLYDDVINFCSEVLLKQMIADPNGVVAVSPSLYNLPQTEFQQPHCVLFNSSQVLDKVEGVYFILQDSETYKNEGKDGKIIHLFTRTAIYTFYETFFTNDRLYILKFQYVHNFNILPAWHLGGVVESRQYPFYYKSFFSPTLPYWNKAIRLESDLDGAYVNHLHPQKWEMTMDCEYVDTEGNMCAGGRIFHSSVGHHVSCPKCKGSGKVSVKSPYEVYQISNDKIGSLEGKSNTTAPAGYITVPTEIITLLKDTVRENLDAGLEAINMDVINKVGEDQSGVAKAIDRSEFHTFIGKISDYLFDNHIPNIFFFSNRYRYGVVLGTKVDEYLPVISKPTQFDDLTITELIDEIARAKESNSNSAYIVALEKDAAQKRFSTNEEIRKEAVLTIDLDPFPNKTVDEKSLMSMDGSVSKQDVIISNNIVDFVKRALEDEQTFAEMTRTQQKEVLKRYAEEITGGAKNEIMGMLEPGMGETPVDIEAEAAAKLKGSVGGAQVITGFVEKVSQGLMNRDAAVESLKFLFKIDDSQASLLLGPISKKPMVNDSGSASVQR